ncbi:flavodoxin family protein [Trinickia fusca]|uniref:Flavodoxin family protein n=1 Tax=Trinickia fusca TaxID=2419777 RepID=A0A494XMM8_9BURK|nr:NAD(P)H-dependent oxidoreductase [Trinickia fusca]RKP49334.1 flavodoxin family protein [Trinickia fusca]
MKENESFLFLLGSARRNGNTEQLARIAAAALPETAMQDWLHLHDYPLPPFVDQRHEPGSVYEAPTGHEARLLERTLAASHLVFAMPLYWYSLPADAKRYLDYWSAWLRVPGVEFKRRMAGKSMSVVTTVSDGDRRAAAPLIDSLRLTADYMSMQFHGAVIAGGNRPGEALAERTAVDELSALLSTRVEA